MKNRIKKIWDWYFKFIGVESEGWRRIIKVLCVGYCIIVGSLLFIGGLWEYFSDNYLYIIFCFIAMVLWIGFCLWVFSFIIKMLLWVHDRYKKVK
mgnify:CR=1 FL=1